MSLNKENPIGRNFGRLAVKAGLAGLVVVVSTACAPDSKAASKLSNAPFYSVAALKQDDGRTLCAKLNGRRIQTSGILSVTNPRYLGNTSLEIPNADGSPENETGVIAIEIDAPRTPDYREIVDSVGETITVAGDVVFYNANPTSNDCWLQNVVVSKSSSVSTPSK